MTRFIVTDLTRFSNPDIVCSAIVNLDSSEFFRPMPYLEFSNCKRLNIQPGTILEGELTKRTNINGPHTEDCDYKNLKYIGPSTSEDFLKGLICGIAKSIELGFSISLSKDQKHLPIDHQINKSIITIQVNPTSVNIREDSYKPGKIKLNFYDQSGRFFSFLPITDLGFYDYAKRDLEEGNLNSLNRFITSQDKVYLRIGLSREYISPDGRNGYWLQVNGIYTFPEYLTEIRNYS